MIIYMNYNHLRTLEKLYGLRILKMESRLWLLSEIVLLIISNWGVGIYKTPWEKEMFFLHDI